MEDNIPIKEIASSDLFNGTKNTLTKYLKLWGVHKPRITIQDNIKDIEKDWLNGMSICKLQDKYKSNKSTITRELRKLGYDIENLHTKIKFDDTSFDSIDTEEKAYWLGFLYADGNIRNIEKSKTKTHTITINLKSSDYNHLVKFNKFLKHEKLNIKFTKDKEGCKWAACSKHMWEVLNSYGCTPTKSLNIKFPNVNIFKSSDLIRHFIRGYFDGDGCISYDTQKYQIVPRLSVLGTEDMINGIKKHASIPNALVQICHTVNDYYNLKLKKSESIDFLKYLYENCNIYLDRKFIRFQIFKDHNFEIEINSPDVEIMKESI